MATPYDHILIAGPTASGKSALALLLADATGFAIVNADALQVYDAWSVLSARPGAEDVRRHPHHLYGYVPPTCRYSVGAWLRALEPLLAEPLIIVGGTGLYLSALTRGLAEIPEVPPQIRAEGDAMRGDADVLRAYVAAHDPVLWRRIDRDNPARLQRAFEVHRATGRPLSTWQAETPPPLLPPDRALSLRLDADPAWLAERIETRFDQMIAAGALEEVRASMEWWDVTLPASRALGAPELMAYLSHEISLEEAISQAKTATRQFAKRQRTWFRSNMSTWRGLKAETLSNPNTLKDILSNA